MKQFLLVKLQWWIIGVDIHVYTVCFCIIFLIYCISLYMYVNFNSFMLMKYM